MMYILHCCGTGVAPVLRLTVSCALQMLEFFLKGNLSLEPHPRKKPHEWLPSQGWQDLMRLTELAAAKAQPGAGGKFQPACLSTDFGTHVSPHSAIGTSRPASLE